MLLVIAALMMLDGLSSGVHFANLVSILSVYPPLTVGLLLCRAAIGALLFASGLLLLQQRPIAPAIGRIALLVSAAVATFEIGFALVPTSLFPSYRWPAVAVYWVYAGSAAWWLGRSRAL